MKQSAYDSDGDGVCDDPVCKDILAVTDEADPFPDQAALIQAEHGAARSYVRREVVRAHHDV